MCTIKFKLNVTLYNYNYFIGGGLNELSCDPPTLSVFENLVFMYCRYDRFLHNAALIYLYVFGLYWI